MGKRKYTAEEYRVFCIILVAIIIVMGIFWYGSDQKRLKLLEENEALNSRIEELKEEIYELYQMYE